MEAETLSLSRGINAPPDLKENFSVGPNANPPAEIYLDEALFVFSENQWPQNPANFQQAWETCYEAMSSISMRLMKLFALALRLPQNYFDGLPQQPISALRANHYPTLNKAVLPGQMRAGEHSDYGSLTLLFQEEGSSGFKILNRQKKWIPVTPCKPDEVVNLGDLMENWTNGRWISKLHRVVAPQNKKDLAQSRMSLAFFQQPDWNARIECLPTCIDYDKTSKYRVLTSGKCLMERFQSTVVNET
ncbi:MAG: isopenicillin N synthase family dioxygenase [bacterium]